MEERLNHLRPEPLSNPQDSGDLGWCMPNTPPKTVAARILKFHEFGNLIVFFLGTGPAGILKFNEFGNLTVFFARFKVRKVIEFGNLDVFC